MFPPCLWLKTLKQLTFYHLNEVAVQLNPVQKILYMYVMLYKRRLRLHLIILTSQLCIEKT